MSSSAHTNSRPPLVAVDPPLRPADLIQSSLFLPISSISLEEHTGRKIRTIGQILAFDPASSLLLLSSSPLGATGRIATLMANTSIPLLGPTPAMKDMYEWRTESEISRPKLKMEKGEWVTVVGWLEGKAPERINRIDPGGSYLPPLPVVLDLIHISSSREPPIGAMYRGEAT